jgi:hypothetical protein
VRAGSQLVRISLQAAVKAVKSRGCKTINLFYNLGWLGWLILRANYTKISFSSECA